MTGGWFLTCAFPFCNGLIAAGTGQTYCHMHRDLPPMPRRMTAVELRTDWRAQIERGESIIKVDATDAATMLDAFDAIVTAAHASTLATEVLTMAHCNDGPSLEQLREADRAANVLYDLLPKEPSC